MIPDELKEQLKEYSRTLANIRWSRATKAEKQALGKILGAYSKATWAMKSDEERSEIMTARARTREENRRRKDLGLPPLPPKREPKPIR